MGRRRSPKAPVFATNACCLEETQWAGAVADQQVLGLLVVFQSHFVGFTADTGFLVTTERCVCRVHVVAVGPYTTGLDVATHAVSTVHVAGPYTGAQTEFGIVSNSQSFCFVFEGGYRDNRAKDLFLEDTHVVAATQQNFSTFGFTDGDVVHDALVLLFRSLSTNLSVGIQRVTADDLASALNDQRAH